MHTGNSTSHDSYLSNNCGMKLNNLTKGRVNSLLKNTYSQERSLKSLKLKNIFNPEMKILVRMQNDQILLLSEAQCSSLHNLKGSRTAHRDINLCETRLW